MDELEKLLSQLEADDEQEGASGAFEEDEEQDEEETYLQRLDDGEICASCEIEFLTHQGEPALCEACWNNSNTAQRQGYIKSTSGTVS